MWFKQGQIEVECGDENGYGSGECGDGATLCQTITKEDLMQSTIIYFFIQKVKTIYLIGKVY